MQRKTNILSLAMMAIVLLLGIFMPSLPNLDDGDENVGCAAVMPHVTRKTANDTATDQRRLTNTERTFHTERYAAASHSSYDLSAAPALFLSQVTPPLRP